MGLTEEGGKIATTAIQSMQGTPLWDRPVDREFGVSCLRRLLLGEVAENARTRNTTQMDLIGKLVTDIRDCRQPGPARDAEWPHAGPLLPLLQLLMVHKSRVVNPFPP